MGLPVKHKVIYDALVQDIHSGRYAVGQKLPTELELAERFDAGRQTVLKALNYLKNEGRLVSYRGRGTFVAEQSYLSTGKKLKQIGFVCSNLQDSFAHKLLLGVEEIAERAGFSIIACNTANSVQKESNHLKRLCDQGIEGVILLPYQTSENEELVKQLVHRSCNQLKMVCIDRGYSNLDILIVRTNNEAAAYEGVSYLISQGHKEIGFIVNSYSQVKLDEVVQARYAGYRKALKDHGIEFRKELVQELGPTLANRRPCDVGIELYGYAPMHKLLSLPNPPTAVFLLWDELAPGAVSAINNSGLRCPDDISLLGFNNDDLCTFMSPKLTTVEQPAEELGRKAAEMLLEQLNGKTLNANDVVLHNKLIVRESVVSQLAPIELTV